MSVTMAALSAGLTSSAIIQAVIAADSVPMQNLETEDTQLQTKSTDLGQLGTSLASSARRCSARLALPFHLADRGAFQHQPRHRRLRRHGHRRHLQHRHPAARQLQRPDQRLGRRHRARHQDFRGASHDRVDRFRFGREQRAGPDLLDQRPDHHAVGQRYAGRRPRRHQQLGRRRHRQLRCHHGRDHAELLLADHPRLRRRHQRLPAAGRPVHQRSGTITSNTGLGRLDRSANLSTAGLNVTPTTGTFTINGVSINYTAGQSLNNLISSINSSSAGVTAVYDSFDDQLVLTSTSRGPQDITVADGTSNIASALRLTSADSTLTVGQSTEFTVNGSSQVRQSNSNVIDPTTLGVPGVTFTATGTGTSEVTVAPDVTTIANAINSFITQYNSTQAEINSLTAVDTSDTADSGPLASDSNLTFLAPQLRQSMTAEIGSTSFIHLLSDPRRRFQRQRQHAHAGRHHRSAERADQSPQRRRGPLQRPDLRPHHHGAERDRRLQQPAQRRDHQRAKRHLPADHLQQKPHHPDAESAQRRGDAAGERILHPRPGGGAVRRPFQHPQRQQLGLQHVIQLELGSSSLGSVGGLPSGTSSSNTNAGGTTSTTG
ncbi:MAG: flagellar filament capping protein FliD [Verrucomicrobiota bacterium]